MSKGDNSPGVSRLAGIIVGAARREGESAVVLDFGEIQGDLSLLTNTCPTPIPVSDYLVCRTVGLPDHEYIDSEETVAENRSHSHKLDEAIGQINDSTGAACSPASSPVNTASSTSKQKPHIHEVDIARPSQRHLSPGDRVLVAWVYNDAVVVDIILQATDVFSEKGE